ncbi:SIMPL domain-containing protein [Cyclobacterium plantarum]|uniref:SIMPL domain-containing protein n=1 Tax=Cyclobacterium plantarum TaxID=2716263 RepID=A0ABX0H6M8_9BACT|nr:SIMPL domain-containing protein [Cyclobacterium plantarum]NHE56156.1 SIMPL domain-containing protein [Cyclobacterium plantarum]
MKQHLTAIIFALAILGSAIVLGNAYWKRSLEETKISVTGLGETDFISDLIVWEGLFEKQANSLGEAYSGLEQDRKAVTEYLNSKGIASEEIVFSAVQTRQNTRAEYNNEGRYMGETFLGYILSQNISIESKEVEKVEKMAREITELLNKEIQFYSQAPRYYFTQLADLKIELISKATEDARLRAEKIAENSGTTLGGLITANMGIFQITGQNSGEDYSWGGTFNTSSKAKTASITMKLDYRIK